MLASHLYIEIDLFVGPTGNSICSEIQFSSFQEKGQPLCDKPFMYQKYVSRKLYKSVDDEHIRQQERALFWHTVIMSVTLSAWRSANLPVCLTDFLTSC